MAKKIRRPLRANTPAVTPVVISGPAVATSLRSAEKEFTPNYSPIIKDLRRIGLLAGVFFALLVILAFLMPVIQPLILR